MDASESRRTLRRAAVAAATFVVLLFLGTAAFIELGGEGLEEAFYRSLGTFTGAGYVSGPDSSSERAVSAVLTVVGGLFYLALVAGVVDTLLRRVLADLYRERRMRREIGALDGHYVVCGYGRVGRAVVQALLPEHDVVVVEKEDESWSDIERHPEYLRSLFLVRGDGDEDGTLSDARLSCAAGLVACVGSDAENMYIALAARRCNDQIRVVVRASDEEAEKNLNAAKGLLTRAITPYTSAGDQLARAVVGDTGRAE